MFFGGLVLMWFLPPSWGFPWLILSAVAWIRTLRAMDRRNAAATLMASRRRKYRSDEGWIYRHDIDLQQSEWRTEGRPGQPFFGPGLPLVLGGLAGFATIVTVARFVFH